MGNAVVLAAGSGLVLTALYLLLADQILAMFGGTVNAETFRYSQEYFFYIYAGHPLLYVRADHEPRHPGRRQLPASP